MVLNARCGLDEEDVHVNIELMHINNLKLNIKISSYEVISISSHEIYVII